MTHCGGIRHSWSEIWRMNLGHMENSKAGCKAHGMIQCESWRRPAVSICHPFS